LALAFFLVGGMKLITPTAGMEQLSQGVPVILLRIAGAAEVLGALGLILPAATRIGPVLTPLAASGLVVVMLGAAITNIIIGAYSVAIQPAVLGLLAGFVAWARFTDQAVQPRTAPVAKPLQT
ncbi:DoxX family protein, partial [Halopolyspora algeriensis]